MKRPFLDTIFGPIEIDAVEATAKLLDLFTNEFDDTYLSKYYAKMALNDQEGTYEWTEEKMDLESPQDLLQRIERNRGGRWSCDVNIGFAPGAVYPSLFFDPTEGTTATTVVSIDPLVTEYVEADDGVRIPFVLFLTRIAEAIGARWFLTALEIDHWGSLSVDDITQRERHPPGTYVVCWKKGVLDESNLVGLGVANDEVNKTTTGFRFVTFFPDT